MSCSLALLKKYDSAFEMLTCPYCGSRRLSGNGYTKIQSQRFRCRKCKRTFVTQFRKEELLKKSVAHKIKSAQLQDRIASYCGDSVFRVY